MGARSLKWNAVAGPGLLAVAVCVAACLLWWVGPARAAVPPAIIEVSVSNVASGSATFQASIDPEGTQTTYRFEYGTSESYGRSIPVPDGVVGSGESVVWVQEHPQDLQAHTAYHFRLVVTSAGGTVEGADQTFTTQTAGGELVLPDERAWEMVSPPNKYGALIEPITYEGSPVQAAANGGAMAYATNAPTEANPGSSRSPENMEALSRRGPDGWSSHDVVPPHDSIASLEVGAGQEERIFSLDLSQSIIEPRGQTLLSPEATEQTIYLRNDPVGDFTPLVTAANTSTSEAFGGGTRENSGSVLQFQGASPDLSHIVLHSPVALLSKPQAAPGLFEWAGGQLQLISIDPEGAAQAASALGTTLPFNNRRHAISDDGTHVIWSTLESTGPPHLYLRDTTKQETVQLDAAQGVVVSGRGRPVEFQTASADGSKIFFTDVLDLTPDATATLQAPDLYEYEVDAAGQLTGTLRDVTVDPNPGEAADVQGSIPGASEDGSYVYFVAQGRLTGEPRAGCLAELDAAQLAEEEATQTGRCRAQQGADNLYLREPDPTLPGQSQTVFVASLSAQDSNDWGSLYQLTSRVSPNGRYLAFMSDRSLTGYDNIDANGDVPDEEVYLYNADSGSIVCASCNPTGARPVGVHEVAHGRGPIFDVREFWAGQWLAGNIPGWTGMSLQTALYQSRYLSDSGRLFFNSADALVPQDTDGSVDVYEYEPVGVGDCASSSVTFNVRSGGCVGLISAGSSAEDSAFLDASENGSDVFFLTSAPLAAQDRDSAPDVYDAHVCSAALPCMAAAATPPPCTTADSCRAAPMGQPAIFGAPASATFSGPGNVASSAPAVATAKRAKQKKAHKPKPRKSKKHRSRHKRRKASPSLVHPHATVGKGR